MLDHAEPGIRQRVQELETYQKAQELGKSDTRAYIDHLEEQVRDLNVLKELMVCHLAYRSVDPLD
jgi:hypothetical protein